VTLQLTSDVIIVGSGPGGATPARELARRGKRVLILERGKDERSKPYYGTYAGPLLYADKSSFLYSKEGINLIRPLMLGGATSMYCGCASPPPAWWKTDYGIDLESHVSATIEELELAPLPPELRGTASTRLAEAGRALGMDWQPQMKFMRPARSAHFDCGAKCMLGCRCGAKWNAAEFVDEAVQHGAELRTSAKVKRVLIEDGTAVGVEGTLNGQPFTARANTIILSAGGLGTPRILQNSGFPNAGQGLTLDTTVMVYGVTRERGSGNEPPMTYSWENREVGYKLSTLMDPWLSYPLVMRSQLREMLRWTQWNHLLGVMVKLQDEVSGGVFADGTIHKGLTASDREKLRHAEGVARSILVEAGASRETLFTTPMRGTHPGSTSRIGELVDTNLQTEVNGLFVCDASVFPRALARPTVLTIIALGKRLADHLTTA
jgi:choline dehydrogenase-like flavoprotein